MLLKEYDDLLEEINACLDAIKSNDPMVRDGAVLYLQRLNKRMEEAYAAQRFGLSLQSIKSFSSVVRKIALVTSEARSTQCED